VVLNLYVLVCCLNNCNDGVFSETHAVRGNVDCRMVSLSETCSM